ncbi:MAG: RNA polymerase sigma factor [Spirochaetaceae bacterium]|nr:RNA polymerase sigma factor [Spirochaetaceae bacterium]
MNKEERLYSQDSQKRLSRAYETEKPKLMARIRSAGKSLEETEDLIHDVYTETWGKLDRLANIINLPAWLNTLVSRRLIDAWRHEKVRKMAGETNVAEETFREVIAGVGLDPLDAYVRRCMVEALDEAIKSLPVDQRKVVEAQVFGGKTFAELAELTGENIDTLKARKRYAVKNLSRTLKHWIND